MSEMYHGCDHALRELIRLREKLCEGSAWNPAAIRGLLPARECVVCKKGKPSETYGKKGYRILCSRCGSAWTRREVMIPKGVIQMSRPSRFDAQVVDYVTLAQLILRAPRQLTQREWRASIAAWQLYLDAPLRRALDVLRDEHDRVRWRWTRNTYYQAVERARAEVQWRLEDAGLVTEAA